MLWVRPRRSSRRVGPGSRLIPPLLLALALAIGCQVSQGRRDSVRSSLGFSLSPTDIVQMTQAGLTSDDIIRQIRATGSVYRLTPQQLESLQQQGVAPAVLQAMQATAAGGSRRKTSHPMYGVDL